MLYSYEKALTDTDAWPLEQAYLKQSMTQILSGLEDFDDGAAVESCGDPCCAFYFPSVVSGATMQTENYFDGLCLGKLS